MATHIRHCPACKSSLYGSESWHCKEERRGNSNDGSGTTQRGDCAASREVKPSSKTKTCYICNVNDDTVVELGCGCTDNLANAHVECQRVMVLQEATLAWIVKPEVSAVAECGSCTDGTLIIETRGYRGRPGFPPVMEGTISINVLKGGPSVSPAMMGHQYPLEATRYD